MKKMMSLLLMLSMVLALAACGGDSGSTQNNSGSAAANGQTNQSQPSDSAAQDGEETAEPQMVEGGAFVMAIEETINSLAWYNNNSTDQGGQVFRSLYDPLWDMNKDGTRDYFLAESCDVSEDGLTYTIRLRQDAYWHDGEQVTADDLMFTMDWFNDPDCGATQAASGYKVDGTFCTYEKVDEFTVRMSITRPSNMFAERLGYIHPLPQHIFADVPMAEILTCEENDLGIGTGAFQLKEFVPGEKMVLKRNDNYYGDKAHIDTFEVRCIPNTGTQEVAFRNGELSVYTISNAQTLASFQSEGTYPINSYADGRITFMQINPNSEAMSSMEARQAVIYALNLDEIIDAVGLQLIAAIPNDDAVICAGAQGEPLPECYAARGFMNLAKRMENQIVPLLNLRKIC